MFKQLNVFALLGMLAIDALAMGTRHSEPSHPSSFYSSPHALLQIGCKRTFEGAPKISGSTPEHFSSATQPTQTRSNSACAIRPRSALCNDLECGRARDELLKKMRHQQILNNNNFFIQQAKSAQDKKKLEMLECTLNASERDCKKMRKEVKEKDELCEQMKKRLKELEAKLRVAENEVQRLSCCDPSFFAVPIERQEEEEGDDGFDFTSLLGSTD